MPFGLSMAPGVQQIKRWRRRHPCHHIDDFAFLVRPGGGTVRAMVLHDLQDLGLFVSIEKSMLQPGTMAKLGCAVVHVPSHT